MKFDLPLQTKIQKIYHNFTSFYHNMLLNPLEINLKDIVAIQTDFNGFFSKTALRKYKKSNDTELKQLVLKYLSQYSNLFCFSPQLLLKIIQGQLSWHHKVYLLFTRFRNQKIFQKKIQEMGYESIFSAYTDIFEINWSHLKKNLENFLESSKYEYFTLLFNFKSNLNLDQQPLNLKEKTKLYQGEGLSAKFLKFPYEQIILNVQKFLEGNQFLTTEMMRNINTKIRSATKHMNIYESITLPSFSEKNKNFTSVKVVLKKSMDFSPSIKNIPHEFGHCIQYCNLVIKNNHHNIQKIIPFESAVSELSGEIFESLFCFPEVISTIFELGNSSHANRIANYFRLIDLLFKRNYALYFIAQAKFLSSSKLNLFSRNKTRKTFKSMAKKHLHFQKVSFNLNCPNIIHQLDFIRGLLFIQEPFLQQCQFSLDKFLSHREILLRFFSVGISQQYKDAIRFFSSAFTQSFPFANLSDIKSSKFSSKSGIQ